MNTLAQGTVHTTGFNWESLGTLMLSFFVAVGGGAAFVMKRIDRNRDKTQEFVTEKVGDVTNSLTSVTSALAGRLDHIDQHLADQDKTVFAQNERLARVEGRLMISGALGVNDDR